MSAPVLERALVAAGRPVGRCPVCGYVFDAASSYAGHKGSRRRYCSPDCRRTARNLRGKARREHRRRHAGYFAARAVEGAGQLVMPGAPELPAPPPVRDPVLA